MTTSTHPAPVGLRRAALLVATGLLALGLPASVGAASAGAVPAGPGLRAAPAPLLSTTAAPWALEDGDVPGNLEQIDGSHEPGEKLIEIGSGRYYDTYGKTDDIKFYRVNRTWPGSTVYFGLTVLKPMKPQIYVPWVKAAVEIEGRENPKICGTTHRDREQRARMPLVSVGGSTYAKDKQCVEADSVIIGVGNENEEALQGHKLIPEGTPFELAIYELPPASNRADLTYPNSDPGITFDSETPTLQLTPGPSRSEASLLPGDQSVHVDLPLNQPAWFAMDVETAHYFEAWADVQNPDGAFNGGEVELRVVSPVGGMAGVYGSEDRLDSAGPTATLGDQPVTVEGHSWWISSILLSYYSTRDSLGPSSVLSALPGTWYVVLYARGVSNGDEGTLPVTLTALAPDKPVVGDAPDHTEYVGDVPTLSAPLGAEATDYTAPEATDSPSEGAEPTDGSTDSSADSESAEDDSGPPWALVSALLVGAGLCALGGVVFLLRSRRT